MNQMQNGGHRPPLTPEQQRELARRRAKRAQQKRRQRMLRIALIGALLLILAGVIVFVIHRTGKGQDASSLPASSVPAASLQPESTSQATAEPTPTPTPAATPAPNADDEWQLRLVNASNPLPDDFAPQLATLANGLQFDARAIGALNQMLADGNAQGLSLMVCSAYRSIERQDYLFNSMLQDYVAKGYSEEEAYRITATIRTPHGCSEHSSGLAADIVAVNYQTLDDGFAATPEGKWLAEHAVEYGFILRYPADKQDVTGIIYEPWHFRYVGVENARKIVDSGLCLEEYLG